MNLMLPFDTDDSEFRRGVEVGLMYATLRQSDEQALSFTVHSDCAEMCMRIAESMGCDFSSVNLSEDFIEIEFSYSAIPSN